MPVALFGAFGAVGALAEDVRRLAPGREQTSAEVWIRQGAHAADKYSLTLLHGPGDIERSRVCPLRHWILHFDARCLCLPRNREKKKYRFFCDTQ